MLFQVESIQKDKNNMVFNKELQMEQNTSFLLSIYLLSLSAPLW